MLAKMQFRALNLWLVFFFLNAKSFLLWEFSSFAALALLHWRCCTVSLGVFTLA